MLVCFALVRDIALLEDYPMIEGLHYASSKHRARHAAIAFYERAEDSLPALPMFHRALRDPALDGVVATAMALFGYEAQP